MKRQMQLFPLLETSLASVSQKNYPLRGRQRPASAANFTSSLTPAAREVCCKRGAFPFPDSRLRSLPRGLAKLAPGSLEGGPMHALLPFHPLLFV